MKLKKIIILLFLLSFYACNNSSSTTDKIADSVHGVPPGDHKEDASALSLNNGKKWKSDESTRNHVMKLSEMIRSFNGRANNSSSDYRRFAAEVQTELDGLIKDCRMSGPDHDALHLWLEPILKQVAELKTDPAAEKATEIVQAITKDVDLFNQYFNDAD